jgi:hypothetical protein
MYTFTVSLFQIARLVKIQYRTVLQTCLVGMLASPLLRVLTPWLVIKPPGPRTRQTRFGFLMTAYPIVAAQHTPGRIRL